MTLSVNSENVNKQLPSNMRYEMTEIALANKFSKERLNIKELARKMKSSNKNKSSLNKTNDTSIPERHMKNIVSSEKAKLLSTTTTNQINGESINSLLINSGEHENSKKLRYKTNNNSIKNLNSTKDGSQSEGIKQKLNIKSNGNNSLNKRNIIVNEVSESSKEEDGHSVLSSDPENEYVNINDISKLSLEHRTYKDSKKSSVEKDRY